MDMKIEGFANIGVSSSQPQNQMTPRPAFNFNQQKPQTVILPSDDFDARVTASANMLLAPKATF